MAMKITAVTIAKRVIVPIVVAANHIIAMAGGLVCKMGNE